jgi:hypothetical protein
MNTTLDPEHQRRANRMKVDCGGCKFYKDRDSHQFSGYGVCRRYPEMVKTNDGRWCGEFVAKQEEALTPPEK